MTTAPSSPAWKAVLFDLDGTLADTIELILLSYRHTMRTHLGEAPPDERFLATIGIPLPQGQVTVYEPSDYGPLLVGQTDLGDKAVGQKVELGLGNRPDVQMAVSLPDPKRPRRFELTLTNALARAVDAEIAIPFELKRGRGVEKVDGVPTWKVRVPANGEQRLRFELKKPD